MERPLSLEEIDELQHAFKYLPADVLNRLEMMGIGYTYKHGENEFFEVIDFANMSDLQQKALYDFVMYNAPDSIPDSIGVLHAPPRAPARRNELINEMINEMNAAEPARRERSRSPGQLWGQFASLRHIRDYPPEPDLEYERTRAEWELEARKKQYDDLRALNHPAPKKRPPVPAFDAADVRKLTWREKKIHALDPGIPRLDSDSESDDYLDSLYYDSDDAWEDVSIMEGIQKDYGTPPPDLDDIQTPMDDYSIHPMKRYITELAKTRDIGNNQWANYLYYRENPSAVDLTVPERLERTVERVAPMPPPPRLPARPAGPPPVAPSALPPVDQIDPSRGSLYGTLSNDTLAELLRQRKKKKK